MPPVSAGPSLTSTTAPDGLRPVQPDDAAAGAGIGRSNLLRAGPRGEPPLDIRQHDGSFAVDVLPASLVAAAGMSLAYIPVMMAALSGAAPQEAGLASGIFNTTYQVGSALGLAAATAVAAANGADGTGDLAAMTDAFQAALAAAAAIAAAGALAALSLVARRRRAVAGEGSAQPV